MLVGVAAVLTLVASCADDGDSDQDRSDAAGQERAEDGGAREEIDQCDLLTPEDIDAAYAEAGVDFGPAALSDRFTFCTWDVGDQETVFANLTYYDDANAASDAYQELLDESAQIGPVDEFDGPGDGAYTEQGVSRVRFHQDRVLVEVDIQFFTDFDHHEAVLLSLAETAAETLQG